MLGWSHRKSNFFQCKAATRHVISPYVFSKKPPKINYISSNAEGHPKKKVIRSVKKGMPQFMRIYYLNGLKMCWANGPHTMTCAFLLLEHFKSSFITLKMGSSTSWEPNLSSDHKWRYHWLTSWQWCVNLWKVSVVECFVRSFPYYYSLCWLLSLHLLLKCVFFYCR